MRNELENHEKKESDVFRDVPEFVASAAPHLPLLPKAQRKLEKKKKGLEKKQKKGKDVDPKHKGRKRKIPLPNPPSKRQRGS